MQERSWSCCTWKSLILTSRWRCLQGLSTVSTKKLGLSVGDRCCLALGLLRGNTVITADRLWAKLKLGIQVEVLR